MTVMVHGAARAWGVAMLAALGAHAWSLGAAGGGEGLPHLLWSCHVASLVLGVGLLAERRWLVAAGFLFHVAIGFPAWLVEVLVTQGTFGGATLIGHLLVTSIVVHALPLVAGAVCLGSEPLPWRAVPAAWLMPIVMIPVSRRLTPPEMNINLAHAVWPPLGDYFPSLWVFQTAMCGVTLGALIVAAGAVGLVQRRWRAGRG